MNQNHIEIWFQIWFVNIQIRDLISMLILSNNHTKTGIQQPYKKVSCFLSIGNRSRWLRQENRTQKIDNQISNNSDSYLTECWNRTWLDFLLSLDKWIDWLPDVTSSSALRRYSEKKMWLRSYLQKYTSYQGGHHK